MELAIGITFFIFGIVFGSFFNVVGLRVPLGEVFTNDRSRCPHCEQQLSAIELIPLFSFLLQKGKCRHCAAPIGLMYPIIELGTGLLFTFAYMQLGFTWELITVLLLISLAMILIVSDVRYMLIPNNILLSFLPLFIVLRIIHPLDPWWSSITGAVGGFLLVMMIILVSRGGMGAGDMKLLGVLGIVLGLAKVLVTFFLACLVGAIVGMLLKGWNKLGKKQPIPFGPYLVLAALYTYFYGDGLIDWYLSLLQ